MTKRERNIVLVAVALGIVLLGVRALPALQTLYQEGAANSDRIRLEIEREQRLLDAEEQWQQQRLRIEQRSAELSGQVFEGDAAPLISANIQRMVREYASSNGIAVTSAGLAEPLQTEGCFLVQQALSFQSADQLNQLSFLQALVDSWRWLAVTAFSVRRNRNQYNGDITVVGFSRTEAANVTEQRQ